MVRYHYNIFDGKSSIDDEGTLLPSLAIARREAVRLAADVLFEEAEEDAIPADWHLQVTDDKGVILFTLNFGIVDHTEKVS